jgi:CPA1 family monovalent cation:H+ antiporter
MMMLLLPLLRDLRLAEVTLTIALPYIVFVLSEQYLGVSGVVAVVAAGLVVSAVGRIRFTPETWIFLEEMWEQMAFWASSLVFILASILVPRLLIGISLVDALLIGIVVVAALVARGFVLFALLPLLSATGLSQRVSNAYKFVLLWGGLRGAVTLALALAIAQNRMIDPEIQRFVAILATGFVLFTLLINGTTLRPMIRLLKLDRLSAVDRALRRHVLALSLSNVRDAIEETAQEYKIGPGPARDVLEPYAARVAAVTADKSLDGKIADRDRITIGLVALANRERELFLEHFRHGTLSRPILERLLVNVERIIDGARTDGRVGYSRAARKRLMFDWSFRVAHGLHRRWKKKRPLVKRLADRFETLLVSRIVLEELERFVRRKMTLVLGQRVADLLGEILSHRLEATGKALDALRLKYPAYADALERRFLRQSALRLESAEYDTLRNETLIGPELYNDLRRELQAARVVAAHRPRLDLGLDTRDLVMQFPMFSVLEADQIEEVCRLLRPRFAVPGEKLIRRGDRGESVFFISSGAVEVSREDQRIRLGRGDFFGELAPLSGHRRAADVTALGYCQLLVLDGADFQHLLAADPTIRAQIDRVADERHQKIKPRN